uniref:Putative calcineurin-like phosphoesterase n=1 Tax=viral metagenome TaxID=1070528 RepID=A0A6M3LFQ8_9ZZZZ
MDKKTKQEFIEANEGMDRLRGRPIRLNRKKLEVKKSKNYAEIIFWGDIHYGYPTCRIEKAKEMLDYALKKKIYVILMGDLLEAGLKDSVGDSMYRQKLNPQEQMEGMVEILTPISKAGLIIGIHSGNHEERITKSTGIDITKIMAKLLGISYLGYSCWTLFSVGGIRYSMYSTHGSSGSRFKHTKLKAIMDMAAWINSDILAMGHVHSVASEVIIKQRFDATSNRIVEDKQYVTLTGSYMAWDGSYAQAKNYPITKLGSPKAKLFSDVRGVHFSL